MDKYSPNSVPRDSESIPPFLEKELSRVADSINTLVNVIQLQSLHKEPIRPTEFLLVAADGTDWNPGSGKGIYYYNGSSWIFLG